MASFSLSGIRRSAAPLKTFAVIGFHEPITSVELPGSAASSRLAQSGYRSKRAPVNALSSTLCLSGHTPVAMVDQPGPESVGASGFAYRLDVAVVPDAISAFRFGASAVSSLS